MAVKSFNVDEQVYKRFSGFCRGRGISMSKQVELFMRSWLAGNERVREDYLQKLEAIRKGKFVKVENIDDIL